MVYVVTPAISIDSTMAVIVASAGRPAVTSVIRALEPGEGDDRVYRDHEITGAFQALRIDLLDHEERDSLQEPFLVRGHNLPGYPSQDHCLLRLTGRGSTLEGGKARLDDIFAHQHLGLFAGNVDPTEATETAYVDDVDP